MAETPVDSVGQAFQLDCSVVASGWNAWPTTKRSSILRISYDESECRLEPAAGSAHELLFPETPASA